MSLPKLILGVDPGLRGYIFGLSPKGAALFQRAMPDEISDQVTLLTELTKSYEVLAWVERAQAFPGMGVSGCFKYGRHYGALLGALEALGCEVSTVPPRVWTRAVWRESDALAGDSPKARSLSAFTRIFPGASPVPHRCRVPHDGLVDAALIAWYGLALLKSYLPDIAS